MQEDDRRLNRERGRLINERIQHVEMVIAKNFLTRGASYKSAIHPKLSVRTDVADRQGWTTSLHRT
jgi:hypothetical protein